jgi:hypothetical protein
MRTIKDVIGLVFYLVSYVLLLPVAKFKHWRAERRTDRPANAGEENND